MWTVSQNSGQTHATSVCVVPWRHPACKRRRFICKHAALCSASALNLGLETSVCPIVCAARCADLYPHGPGRDHLGRGHRVDAQPGGVRGQGEGHNVNVTVTKFNVPYSGTTLGDVYNTSQPLSAVCCCYCSFCSALPEALHLAKRFPSLASVGAGRGTRSHAWLLLDLQVCSLATLLLRPKPRC